MKRSGDFGFVFDPTEFGVDLVVTDAWTRAAEKAILSGRADGLNLNYARGFRERDLEFLGDLPLRRLKILARTHADLEPIHRLARTLEHLSVETASTAMVDLSLLPRLTQLSAEWPQVRDTIDQAGLLTRLFLMGYAEQNLVPLSGNQQLNQLVLKHHPRLLSLDGVEYLERLSELGVYGARMLGDTTAIKSLGGVLKELQFESCSGINRIDDMAACAELTFLNVSDCGDLETLKPLSTLLQLRELYLYGTTRIVDADLSPLTQLPMLQELRLRSRRTYKPSTAEVEAFIAGNR